MLLFFLLGLLIYTNARLATKKGKNPFVWGLITLVAFLLAFGILGGSYLTAVYNGPVTPEAIAQYYVENPLVITIMVMLGIGGVLLVRYILERTTPRNPAP